MLEWFNDFLNKRRQRVMLWESVSEWNLVTSGVPHGSLLRPLQFAVFINDLPENVLISWKLSADDSKIFSQVSTLESYQKLQRDRSNISDWYEMNKLDLVL